MAVSIDVSRDGDWRRDDHRFLRQKSFQRDLSWVGWLQGLSASLRRVLKHRCRWGRVFDIDKVILVSEMRVSARITVAHFWGSWGL